MRRAKPGAETHSAQAPLRLPATAVRAPSLSFGGRVLDRSATSAGSQRAPRLAVRLRTASGWPAGPPAGSPKAPPADADKSSAAHTWCAPDAHHVVDIPEATSSGPVGEHASEPATSAASRVSLHASGAVPASSGAPVAGRHLAAPDTGPGGRASGRVAGVAAVALAVLALVALFHHRDAETSSLHSAHGPASAGAPSVTRVPLPAAVPAATPHGPLGPIVLLPPFGEVPRTQPEDTMLVVDAGILSDPSAAAAVAAELPVDIAYLQRYSIKGDEVGTPQSGLVSVSDPLPAIDALVSAEAPVSPGEAASEMEVWWAGTPKHDHALIVMSTPQDVQTWTSALRTASLAARDESEIGGTPVTRTYIVDVSTGTSSTLVDQAPEASLIGADPGRRGSLASAVAHCWVDAVDAGWLGTA